MLKEKRIGFIGGGRMGEALIRGLLLSQKVTPDQIGVFDKVKERLAYLSQHYKVKTYNNNPQVVDASEIVIIAVRSNDVKDVVKEIGDNVGKERLLITITSGVSTDFIKKALSYPIPPIIRARPNTPIFCREGITAIYPRNGAKEHIDIAIEIFETVGKVVVVDREEMMDAISGLSGSGPAYIFLIMEALCDAGVSLGLPREMARLLAIQTVLGSARLALKNNKHLAELKDMVSSPGGATIAGLRVLEEEGIRGIIIKAVCAAAEKSKELAEYEWNVS